ncbi:hypothetical protein [Caballeronia sp. LZ035]|uniref:hypothetical protein n=1 Tax=Caballeronia sp. LZ035 TaxID=3038568 RepID=UPI0028613D44|nr:hypothetical protein [Caballeronia sp. LZ035]MDR5758193.1 hypothetical protein [Caballeronia sp. LZ035]
MNEEQKQTLADMERECDQMCDRLEWLKARYSLTEQGEVNLELEDEIARAEGKFLSLVVACMAHRGTPPTIPGYIN